MATHELKTDSRVFQKVKAGTTLFKIRKNGRAYAVGDTLLLRETRFSGAAMAAGSPLEYTGDELTVTVLQILHGPVYGLAEGTVIMSITRAQPPADLVERLKSTRERMEQEVETCDLSDREKDIVRGDIELLTDYLAYLTQLSGNAELVGDLQNMLDYGRVHRCDKDTISEAIAALSSTAVGVSWDEAEKLRDFMSDAMGIEISHDDAVRALLAVSERAKEIADKNSALTQEGEG